MNVQATYGPTRKKRTSLFALVGAAMLVVMIVAQLYGFDAMPDSLAEVVVVDDSALVRASAGIVVLVELLALPYLLGMYISPLLRIVSAGLAFGVSCFWLFIAFTNAHVQNSGLFSDTVTIPGGLLPALWVGILFFIVCWVIAADSNYKPAST